MTLALAALQESLPKTPDTGGYLKLGYAAILGVIAPYAVWLCIRSRRAGKDRHAQ